MHPHRPRLLPVSLSLALLAAGCSRCTSPSMRGPPAAPERFLAADSAAVLVIPSLAALSRQGGELLATAASFPGGQDLLDARAVLEGRLGFDVFDAASVAEAGLDPKRGAAVGARVVPGSVDVGDEQPLLLPRGDGSGPDVIVSLPVSDPRQFDDTLTRLASGRLGLAARAAAAGKPAVIAFRRMEGDAVQLAYGLAEQTAVLGFGPKAVEDVRAALAVPAAGHIGTMPAYRTAAEAAGPGLAVLAFLPPGSPLAGKNAQARDGFAVGLRGAKERIDLVACTVLGAREAAVKAGARGASGALLSKLDPGAAVVARQDTDLWALVPREDVAALFSRNGAGEKSDTLILEAMDAVGSGAALGFGLIPMAGGARSPVLQEAPLAFLKLEVLLALKDPARMKSVVARAATDYPEARLRPAGEGRWTTALAGGEVALSIEGQQLLFVAGPAGALKALSARTGSSFQGPTPVSAKVLEGTMGGMYADVRKLAAGARAIPESAYGTGTTSGALHSSVQEWAATAARIPAVSGRSDLLPGVQRSELTVELALPEK